MEVAIGVIGTCLGAIIGIVGTYLVAIRIAHRQDFNKAAAIFRSAFIEEKRLLSQRHTYDVVTKKGVYDILKAAIIRHEKAMIRFREYLTEREKRCFDKAWKEYYSEGEANYCLCDYETKFDEKTGKPDLEFEKGLMKLALTRIDELLKFTKPK